MNELILRLVSKKVNIDGQYFLQPPSEGLKKEYLIIYQINNLKKNIKT